MNTVKVNVLNVETYHGDFPPEDIKKFQSWLNDKISMIPASYLPSAKIEIDGYSDYDNTTVTIEISYVRPMTDGEEASKADAANNRQKATEGRERRELERLKAKYEQ